MDKCSPCEFDISRNKFGLSDSDVTNSASHRGERSGSEVHAWFHVGQKLSWTPVSLPQAHGDFATKVDATDPHHSIHLSGMN